MDGIYRARKELRAKQLKLDAYKFYRRLGHSRKKAMHMAGYKQPTEIGGLLLERMLLMEVEPIDLVMRDLELDRQLAGEHNDDLLE
jgi:hypothetical protein